MSNFLQRILERLLAVIILAFGVSLLTLSPGKVGKPLAPWNIHVEWTEVAAGSQLLEGLNQDSTARH